MAAKKSPTKRASGSKAKNRKPPGPWSPSKATQEIRKRARAADFTIWPRDHAIERMEERGLFMGDVLHILKNGFVYNDPEPSTREGLYKYAIEGKSPNSVNRDVRLIVIPEPDRNALKLITVMWVD